jgi:hypothetical protein
LVARLPRRVGVWGGGAAGGVWRLTEAGHRLRRLPVEPHPQETNNGTSNRRARFTEPSPQFLAHTLRVADIRLALEQLTVASEGRVELTTVQTEPTCWRSWTGPYGAPATLRPDLYAETTSGDYLDCWFIEADMGTEHLTAIVKKARAYQAYWRSGREQAALGVFPLVVWVTPDERRAQAIAGAVAGDTGCDNRLHRAAPFERLVEAVTGHVGTADKTLKTPIEGSQS